jgi:hypothetical protein
MLSAALIPTMLCEPFGDGPELRLYGLFMRADVLRYRPFAGCSLTGRAVERRVLARRLAGRRIDPFMIFDVAQVLSDRCSIA